HAGRRREDRPLEAGAAVGRDRDRTRLVGRRRGQQPIRRRDHGSATTDRDAGLAETERAGQLKRRGERLLRGAGRGGRDVLTQKREYAPDLDARSQLRGPAPLAGWPRASAVPPKELISD